MWKWTGEWSRERKLAERGWRREKMQKRQQKGGEHFKKMRKKVKNAK